MLMVTSLYQMQLSGGISKVMIPFNLGGFVLEYIEYHGDVKHRWFRSKK